MQLQIIDTLASLSVMYSNVNCLGSYLAVGLEYFASCLRFGHLFDYCHQTNFCPFVVYTMRMFSATTELKYAISCDTRKDCEIMKVCVIFIDTLDRLFREKSSWEMFDVFNFSQKHISLLCWCSS